MNYNNFQIQVCDELSINAGNSTFGDHHQHSALDEKKCVQSFEIMQFKDWHKTVQTIEGGVCIQ